MDEKFSKFVSALIGPQLKPNLFYLTFDSAIFSNYEFQFRYPKLMTTQKWLKMPKFGTTRPKSANNGCVDDPNMKNRLEQNVNKTNWVSFGV